MSSFAEKFFERRPICACAVHAGVINVSGGGFVVEGVKSRSYSAIKRNGITSQAYGEYQGISVGPCDKDDKKIVSDFTNRTLQSFNSRLRVYILLVLFTIVIF